MTPAATEAASFGAFPLADCLADGALAGAAAAQALGLAARALDLPSCPPEEPWSIRPLWEVKPAHNLRGKRFVDLQDDVTADDLDFNQRRDTGLAVGFGLGTKAEITKVLHEVSDLDVRLELVSKAQQRLVLGFFEDDVVMFVSDREIGLPLVAFGGLR